jgi:hypothetical protein
LNEKQEFKKKTCIRVSCLASHEPEIVVVVNIVCIVWRRVSVIHRPRHPTPTPYLQQRWLGDNGLESQTTARKILTSCQQHSAVQWPGMRASRERNLRRFEVITGGRRQPTNHVDAGDGCGSTGASLVQIDLHEEEPSRAGSQTPVKPPCLPLRS